MSQLNPITNNLVEKLYSSITSGELKLSEHELRGVIRDAKKLPYQHQAFSIEGLCLILKGDFEAGCVLCEKAITLAPLEPASWLNFVVLLNNLAKFQRVIDVLKRAVRFRDFDIARQCIVNAGFWLDYDLLKEAYMVISQFENELPTDVKSAVKTYYFLREDETLAASLQRTARIVMSIAEQEGLKGTSSYVEKDGDGTIAFNFRIKTEDANFLSHLNDRIVTEMVQAGLESSNCLAFFEAEEA